MFEPSGQRRVAVNGTFATDPNTPAPGFSLYRFSTGHGGLRCEACHGSTHAEYPSLHGNDNIQVEALQGHGGMLVDCTTCHDQDPETVTGGPHGMHPVGAEWLDDHGDAAENGNHLQCRTCHGSDYKGTVLSLSLGDRTFNTEFGQRHFWRGFRISCYACHNGPTSENASPNHAPVVQNTTAQASDQPVMIPLTATDQDQNPLTLRVISQPQYGTVALSGTQATYFPQPGFAGPDTFTFAAWDGFTDSNLGTVTVTRGGGWFNYGTGFPGTGGVVPAFVASAAPVLGTTIQVSAENTSGAASVMALVVSDEPASIPTPLGGSILVHLTAAPIVAPIPASGWVASLALPTDPSLTGVTVRAQVAIADPGAAFGLAFSEGLCLIFGP